MKVRQKFDGLIIIKKKFPQNSNSYIKHNLQKEYKNAKESAICRIWSTFEYFLFFMKSQTFHAFDE